MAIQFLENLRKKLSSTVDGSWVGQLEAKDALENIARDSGYADCLRRAFEAGATRDAYRSCAKEAGISSKYKEAWGKRGGS